MRTFKTVGVPDPSHSLSRKEAHCQGEPHSFSTQATGIRLGSQPASLWSIGSLVRKAGSDLGTWHTRGRYLVALPRDHPAASRCHQAIVVWAAPASLELTENWVRGREAFLGQGHVTSRGGGMSSHRRGEDGSPHTALWDTPQACSLQATLILLSPNPTGQVLRQSISRLPTELCPTLDIQVHMYFEFYFQGVCGCVCGCAHARVCVCMWTVR